MERMRPDYQKALAGLKGEVEGGPRPGAGPGPGGVDLGRAGARIPAPEGDRPGGSTRGVGGGGERGGKALAGLAAEVHAGRRAVPSEAEPGPDVLRYRVETVDFFVVPSA